jgi:hypothetical protein
MKEEGEQCRGRWRSGYGSTPEEVTKRRRKRGCTRSVDGGAIDVGEEVEQVDRQEELRWSEVVCG